MTHRYFATTSKGLENVLAEEVRALARNVSYQLHQWIASMQTPDFSPGPKYHKSPPAGVRRWELYLEQIGLVRMPNDVLDTLDSDRRHRGQG